VLVQVAPRLAKLPQGNVYGADSGVRVGKILGEYWGQARCIGVGHALGLTHSSFGYVYGCLCAFHGHTTTSSMRADRMNSPAALRAVAVPLTGVASAYWRCMLSHWATVITTDAAVGFNSISLSTIDP